MAEIKGLLEAEQKMLQKVLASSHYSKIIRQLIQDLKTFEIQKTHLEFGKTTTKSDSEWASEYKERCNEMYEKYEEDKENHYLRSLFTYNVKDYMGCIQPSRASLKNYDSAEVKAAVECRIFRVSRHSLGPGGGVPGMSDLGAENPEIRGFGGWPPITDSNFGDSRASRMFTVVDIFI
jgi:hypothetical protein